MSDDRTTAVVGRYLVALAGDAPELLPEVRDGWRRLRAVQARLGALFPGPGSA